MTADPSPQIAIDREILLRSATTLHDTATRVATASHTIASVRVGGNAFGLMNAWMVPPVASLATHSHELLDVSAKVVEVVAIATDAAVETFDAHEDQVLAWVEQLDAQMDAASAAPSTAPPTTSGNAPQPTPSPSPLPSPTPVPGS